MAPKPAAERALVEPLLVDEERIAEDLGRGVSWRLTGDKPDAPEGAFRARDELRAMASLVLPLASNSFCRMCMASTDSAFVGHISVGAHDPEEYLAVALLSDIVTNMCIASLLAFDRILNSLIGQAVGAGNPVLAGV